MAKEDHAAGSSISGRRVEAGNPEHLESIVQKTDQQTVPEQTPNEAVRVFKLDSVRSPTKVGLIGRVEEIGQHSTKSEESSPDPGYRGGLVCVLLIGEIRVQWTDLSETVENVDDVVVVDRPFVHGDTVSAVSDKSGETGTVVDVDIRVDLRSFRGEERIIRNVSSRELVRLRGFNAGDFVLNGPWVGRVEDIYDDVTVAFEDGGVCEVTNFHLMQLCPVLDYLGNRRFRYYPGQRLKDSYFYSTAFHDSRWIAGCWDPSRVEGTVIRVQAGSVEVQWLASSSSPTGHGLISVVRSSQTIHDPSRDLELLSCLAQENWRLGDWCHLCHAAVDSQESAGETFSPRWASRGQGTDEDGNWCRPSGRNDCSKSETHNDDNNNGSSELGSCSGSVSATKRLADQAGSRSSRRRKLRKVGVKMRDLKEVVIDEISQKPFLIVRTRTRVDVVWQSGVRQNGILSTDLIRIHGDPPAGDQFYPEQYVVQEPSINVGEDEHISEAVKRVGVVSSFDVKERVARVRWLKHVSSLTEAPSEFAEEETVSVHELHRHLDYRHRYGDIVIRPFAGRNIDEQLPQLQSGRDRQLAPQQPDLTRVGKITGLKDGGIQVTWADGIVSTVGPQAVFSVGRSADFSEDDDDDEGEDGFDYLVDS